MPGEIVVLLRLTFPTPSSSTFVNSTILAAPVKQGSLKFEIKEIFAKKIKPPFLKRVPTFSFNKLFQLFLRKICDDVGLLIRRVGEVRWAEWN